MKKVLPYIVGGALVILFLAIIFQTKKDRHIFDERLSFNKRDKIPYGTYVAYRNLNHIFPEASVMVNRKDPSRWDSLSSLSDKQALIIISPSFLPDESELQRLLGFAKAGNTIFISSRMYSSEAQAFFNCKNYFSGLSIFGLDDDTLSISLLPPLFMDSSTYDYPGKRYDSYFGSYDEDISHVLGKKQSGEINFIRLKAGLGNIFLHLAPLAFSNYFLLHDQNIDYYNQILSLIPRNTKKVVWDEYFLYKRFPGQGNSKGDKSMLSALMSQKSFKAALWLLIILLLLFVLQEMRRKQRILPLLANPRNDSLEFVKTIGRLYYEKRDNKNLSHKMSAYFLEHVRNRYKLSTTLLDTEFIELLQKKTGEQGDNIKKIVSFINEMDERDFVSDEELADFHKRLEEFYKIA